MSADGRLEAGASERRIVQQILRGGLALSAVLLVAGVAASTATNDLASDPVRLFRISEDGGAGEICTMLGVVLLAMTPAVRVLALVVLWWQERDHRFVGVALAVIATLSAAVLLGRG